MINRRVFLGLGGVFAARLFRAGPAYSNGVVEIEMAGRPDGSRVWFNPLGVLVEPGQVVRWTNRDQGNSHTATAYHPANDGKSLRIPVGAQSWDSDYLLPGESFDVALTKPGVYDYFCIPHEHGGMVGRLLVGRPSRKGLAALERGAGDLPEAAVLTFPSVEDIVEKGMVRPPAVGTEAVE